jgi:hypothetical protein
MGRPCRLLTAVLALITAACGGGDDSITQPPPPGPPPPTFGQISVRVTTIGGVPDPDGYTVLLDGSAVGTVTPQGELVVSEVRSGHHVVELDSIAPSCDPHAGTASELTVGGGDITVVSFTIPCPGLATARLVTHTTGSRPDPDGYRVTVEGTVERAIGIEDTVEVPDLPAGVRTITLAGVAANSTAGTPQRRIDLPPGDTTDIVFEVSCLGSDQGSIVVSVSTTAILIPLPLTFAVELDGGHRLSVPSAGTVTYADVEAGSHSVRLALPGYCGVGLFGSPGTNPVHLDLRPGERQTVEFHVLCIG